MGKFSSYLTFLALVGYVVAVKLLLAYTNFPPEMFPHPSQRESFSWDFILLGVLVPGLVGVWLAHLTGFPAMWDPRVSNARRFLLPATLGAVFGLGEVVADHLTDMTEVVCAAMNLPFFHMRFPASALVYPGGAVIVDTLFHLFAIPFVLALVLLVARVYRRLRGRRAGEADVANHDTAFWVVAAILSLIEPVTQSGVLGLLPGRTFRFAGHGGLVAYWLVEGYLVNLSQAWLFRRYGFLACLTLRLGLYLVWHVLWGYLTQASLAA
jgi:hypothetical protein